MSGSFLPPHFREDEALPRLEIHLSPVLASGISAIAHIFGYNCALKDGVSFIKSGRNDSQTFCANFSVSISFADGGGRTKWVRGHQRTCRI